MERKRRETTDESGVLLVEKRPGETMGMLTRRIRKEKEIQEAEKITYAGRLDPLARGLVILLVGEARFRKEDFLGLSKKYRFDIVFGVRTDTSDVLGLLEDADTSARATLEGDVRTSLRAHIGKQVQQYPAFSSRPHKGRPLFEYAKKGMVVELPEHEIEIYSLELKEFRTVSRNEFLGETLLKIKSIEGDFRQEAIKKRWLSSAENLPETLKIAHCEAFCSSGTYIRVLAQDIGKRLGTAALADNIVRTQIGNFTL